MKRSTAIVLVSIIGSTLTASPASGVAGFGDVEADLYYAPAVQWMVDLGLTTGTTPTCFSPDSPVTRGQLAAFLHRHAGAPTGAPDHPFQDVTAPWQQAPVSWMTEQQITTGTSPTTYQPDSPVTRGQLAAFLHRYAGQPSTTVDPHSPRCELTRTPRQVTETEFTAFATAGPVTLTHPAARVELIGFHESNHDGAQQITAATTSGPTLTMPSRGRGNPSRSAADVVVDPSGEIVAPVSGRVLRSGGYTLYCNLRDEFVVIEPDDRPGWEVKVLHLDGVTVSPGDVVTAAATVIAQRPTQLPFVSQVDQFTAEPSWPHVHVEVVDPSVPDRPGRGC